MRQSVCLSVCVCEWLCAGVGVHVIILYCILIHSYNNNFSKCVYSLNEFCFQYFIITDNSYMNYILNVLRSFTLWPFFFHFISSIENWIPSFPINAQHTHTHTHTHRLGYCVCCSRITTAAATIYNAVNKWIIGNWVSFGLK